MSRISHVGIAVRDLEKSISDYQRLVGFEKVEVDEVPSERVRVAMITLNGSKIELLAPSGGEEGAISKFLSERGEGVHHIAIAVADVGSEIERARSEGFRVIDDKPRRGAFGAEAAFVHPKSAHGVLLEFYNR